MDAVFAVAGNIVSSITTEAIRKVSILFFILFISGFLDKVACQ
jgi:hypothetical protein